MKKDWRSKRVTAEVKNKKKLVRETVIQKSNFFSPQIAGAFSLSHSSLVFYSLL